MMKGADALIECFKKEKVDTIFGYPGGYVIDIFHRINKTDIDFVLTRHEQGAVHAADGYARATGKVGVCIATSGPGATNLITGIATAHMDSIPMVVITGQVPTTAIGNDAFQEADVTGITRPISKHNYLVKSVDELPQIMKEAFYIASTGRPGPVVVDIPKDIQQADTAATYPETISMRSYNPNCEGHEKQLDKVIEAIAVSKKPLIYAGGGVIAANAAKELTDFAHKGKIPVTTTLMGLGSFPEEDELALHMLGMHGTRYANYAVMQTDLLIAVGSRFDDRVTGKLAEFAPHAKIIHMDIDPTSISKNVTVDIPVVGDIKNILGRINKKIKAADTAKWLEQIKQWKEKHPLAYEKTDKTGRMTPQYVIDELYKVTNGDAIVVTEVGQHQMWAAHFYKFKNPRTFISSGGLGTMGYGFPAAIGAQLGCPDKLVVDIAGDGSIQMNIQELATAVLNKLPVKIIILNNGYLGMVRQWQELFYDKNYAFTCLMRNKDCDPNCNSPKDGCPVYIPDFVKLAEAYGACGMRITDADEVPNALKAAMKNGQTTVMEFIVAQEENVFPMVPAGKSISEMIGGMA